MGKDGCWREDHAIAFPTINDQRLSTPLNQDRRPSPMMPGAAGLLSGSTYILMGRFRPLS